MARNGGSEPIFNHRTGIAFRAGSICLLIAGNDRHRRDVAELEVDAPVSSRRKRVTSDMAEE